MATSTPDRMSTCRAATCGTHVPTNRRGLAWIVRLISWGLEPISANALENARRECVGPLAPPWTTPATPPAMGCRWGWVYHRYLEQVPALSLQVFLASMGGVDCSFVLWHGPTRVSELLDFGSSVASAHANKTLEQNSSKWTILGAREWLVPCKWHAAPSLQDAREGTNRGRV
jgi:hypothetical protein